MDNIQKRWTPYTNAISALGAKKLDFIFRERILVVLTYCPSGRIVPCPPYPKRDPNNSYRIYSPEDLRTLKLIRMLRMLDMPLEEIRQEDLNCLLGRYLKNAKALTACSWALE